MSDRDRVKRDGHAKESRKGKPRNPLRSKRKRPSSTDDASICDKPAKKRRKLPGPQHKFHHGGDITDPLNLRCDNIKGVDKAAATEDGDHGKDVVQNSSLPANVNDPLNLLADIKREKKKRKKQRKDAQKEASEEVGDEHKEQKWKKRKRKSSYAKSDKETAAFRPKDVRFVYGNYNRYYGYRNPKQSEDVRLSCLPKRLFAGKKCLDIGCNAGHVTLAIARKFSPRHILGIDIDNSLIELAKKNICHYLKETPSCQSPVAKFPLSFQLTFGPIVPQVMATSSSTALKNVSFEQSNYIADSIGKACAQEAVYDTILCLSITKWVHYNWGDSGIHRLFHRIYHHLKPGGVLVLEPQSWQSYHKKRKLTPTTFANYNAIQLFPEKFSDYLVDTVGFVSVDALPTPKHKSAGFQRPMLLFTKSTTTDSFCNRCRPSASGEKKQEELPGSVESKDQAGSSSLSNLASNWSCSEGDSDHMFETSTEDSEALDSDAYNTQDSQD